MPNGTGAVVAVCGLTSEARIARGAGVRTIAGGGRSTALARAIEEEIEAGACGLISFGVAGALVAGLAPGSLVIPEVVVHGAANYRTDPRWSAALAACLPGAHRGMLAGSDSIAATREEKVALHLATGAAIVDMESHVAARLAARHGLPFAVLRAVADPLDRALPAAALVAMDANGGLALGAVLASLLRDPRQLPRLLRIGLDAQRALRSLDRAHRALGVRLGYPDLDQLSLDVIREDVLRGPFP